MLVVALERYRATIAKFKIQMLAVTWFGNFMVYSDLHEINHLVRLVFYQEVRQIYGYLTQVITKQAKSKKAKEVIPLPFISEILAFR